MSTARVIEVGDETAGIAVPQRPGNVHFFSAAPPFHQLDGREFRSFDEVVRAARDCLQRSSRLKRASPQQIDARGRAAV